MIVPLPALNGVLPPSGQVKFSVPLSVVNAMIVLSRLQLGQQAADHVVELRHHGLFQVPLVVAGHLRLIFRRQMRDDMRAGGVHPQEERLVLLLDLVDELHRVVEDVLVDRLHVVLDTRHGVRRQRPLILDRLPADPAPPRLDRLVVGRGGEAVDQVARSDLVSQRRGIRVPERVLHGVEVIQVTEKLVEAMHGRKVAVQVAEMVLAELGGGVSHRLQSRGDRRGLVRNADRGAGLADRRQARADRQLAGDEVGATGGAARLRVVIGEAHALGSHLVEVRRGRIHQALVVGSDVHPPDIVAHNDDDIGPLLRGCRRAEHRHGDARSEQTEPDSPGQAHGLVSSGSPTMGRERVPECKCVRDAVT